MTAPARVRVHLSEHVPEHAALVTNRGAHTGRPTLLLGLELAALGGEAVVWSEACPLPGFGDSEDHVDLARAELCALDEQLLAAWLSQPALRGLEAVLAGTRPLRSAAARHAIEWAAIEALARLAGTGPAELLHAWLNQPEQRVPGGSWPALRQVVPASAVLDPLDSQLTAQAKGLAQQGILTWKLKCGRDVRAEERAVEDLARLGLGARLRLDPGCGWTLASALAFVRGAQAACQGSPLDLEFVEDPTPEPDEWEELTALAPTAADEVLAARGRPLPSARSSAFWLLKPMVHGVGRVLELARHGTERGQRLVLSHAFDGPLALRTSSELACVLQAQGFAAGLGPHVALGAWSEHRLASGRLLRGEQRGPGGLGKGVLVDGGQLARVLTAQPRPRQESAATLPRAEPGGDALSVSRAAAIYDGRIFLDLGQRQASFAELSARQLGHRAASSTFVPLVADPSEAGITALLGALERQTPALLLHPSSTATARQLAIEHATRHASELQAGDALIVPTSGSTGAPHLVVHTRSSLLAALSASAARLGAPSPESRWLLSLPFSHVGGVMILLRCLAAGACVVVGPLPKAPADVLRLLRDRRVTHLSVVPTQLRRWLEDPEFAFPPSVECVLVGGADASPSLRRLAAKRGAPVVYSYGLTEMASQVATQAPSLLQHQSVRSGVGTALPTVELALTGDGRLRVGGPMLMRRYLGESAPIEQGLLTTSDAGQLTVEGTLSLVGRLDDLIITGGENVTPSSVESVLAEVGGVLDVCVLGQPSDDWGQQVVALIVASRPDIDWSALELDLKAAAHARLPPFARPKAYHLRGALPLLESGKIDRPRLTAELASLLKPG